MKVVPKMWARQHAHQAVSYLACLCTSWVAVHHLTCVPSGQHPQSNWAGFPTDGQDSVDFWDQDSDELSQGGGGHSQYKQVLGVGKASGASGGGNGGLSQDPGSGGGHSQFVQV